MAKKTKGIYGAMLDPSQAAFPMDPNAGVDPEGYDPFLKALGIQNSGADPLLSPKRFPVLPAQMGVAGGSGLANSQEAKSVDEDTSGTKSMTQTNKKLILDNPDFKTLLNRTEGSDVFKQQKAGIDQMRDVLSMAAHAPSDVFSGPIAGLLQSEFGRNTSVMNANKGATPFEQTQKILGYQDKVQDDQKDYAKNLFEAIGKQQGGSQLDSLLQAVNAKQVAEQINKNTETDPNKFKKSGGKGYDPTKDVKELGKSLAPMTATINTMNKLDQLIGGIDNWHGQNIPGAGAMGRLAPSFMLSQKGSDVQQTYRELQEELLKLYNGARITDPEYKRLSQALGSNLTGGDREFVGGLKRFRDEFTDIMQQKEAPFRGTHPEVISLYKKGGGRTSDAAFPGVPAGAGGGKPPGGKKLEDMSNDELKAYLGGK